MPILEGNLLDTRRLLVWYPCMVGRDGAKMSKRKKNYPDPMEIVSKYGADALR